MQNKQLDIFIYKLQFIIENNELVKLVISKKRFKSSDLKKITISLVELKDGLNLNFLYTHNTQDITKNYDFNEGLSIIKEAITSQFYNADIFSNSENINLISSKKGQIRLKIKEPSLQPLTSFNHDRTKFRLIETTNNIYLKELGVTNSKGDVSHKMIDKYKQINRYIELLAPNLDNIAITNDSHIVDMGSGKGYLTFALYDYLVNNQKKNIQMTGVEFRQGLVKSCNSIAEKAGFTKLGFTKGTIENAIIDKIDVLIALHACDTATDEAIYRGIKANASLIVCAPCCHKQIRKEMSVTNELSYVVKHGILKERQAEIITDSLRAMIMEVHGYKTNIFEFISTEHTPKNLMIVGKKTSISDTNKNKILQNIKLIKKMYGIEKHYLEGLLESVK